MSFEESSKMLLIFMFFSDSSKSIFRSSFYFSYQPMSYWSSRAPSICFCWLKSPISLCNDSNFVILSITLPVSSLNNGVQLPYTFDDSDGCSRSNSVIYWNLNRSFALALPAPLFCIIFFWRSSLNSILSLLNYFYWSALFGFK